MLRYSPKSDAEQSRETPKIDDPKDDDLRIPFTSKPKHRPRELRRTSSGTSVAVRRPGPSYSRRGKEALPSSLTARTAVTSKPKPIKSASQNSMFNQRGEYQRPPPSNDLTRGPFTSKPKYAIPEESERMMEEMMRLARDGAKSKKFDRDSELSDHEFQPRNLPVKAPVRPHSNDSGSQKDAGASKCCCSVL